jgi:hypothetical protein
VNHIAGTDHGTAKVVSRIGHFTIAAGDFDDTPRGKAAKRYYERHKAEGVSHGFAFDTKQLIDGVYHQYNTFEISPLFGKLPANPFTTFDEVKDMKPTEQDIKLLNEMFGEDVVKTEILAKTEQADKALVEAGIAFKEFVDPTPAEPASTEAVKAVETDLKSFLLQLVGDHAEVAGMLAVSGKAVQELNTKLDSAMGEIAALQEVLDARPRSASQDQSTVVNQAQVNKDVIEQLANANKGDSFWTGAAQP